jgi:sarcosine oxidase subunit gamma
MPEPTPIAPVLDKTRLVQGAHHRATLTLLPHQAQFVLRGAASAYEAAATALALPSTSAPCAAANKENAALWLGPDEWLLLVSADQTPAINLLTGALDSELHSLVDVSHRNTAFLLQGHEAPLVLNAGCPLDFDIAAFPIGMCTRTIMAKATVVIWRRDAHMFYLNTWRSFAPYVWDFLIEARTRL